MEMIRLDDSTRKELLVAVAALYCEIWREPPWNERHWTIQCVVGEIQRILSLEGSIVRIMVDPQGEIVGFTWGHLVSRMFLAQATGSRLMNYLADHRSRIFYIDELGVSRVHRRRGYGRKLLKSLVGEVLTMDTETCLLRTSGEALPAVSLYSSMGFKELSIRDQEHPDRSYWMLCV